ncbi:hypothetical protein [Longispora albida]|uniref:Rv0361 family membrane protein n=1 Tax=Longispora albida TaxID=203523 RepID=UPI00037AE962|nr:hypothetical protein [Longispora albida]
MAKMDGVPGPGWVPPGEAKPKRNTTKIVLIVVGVVLAVCCLGGVGGGFLFYRTIKGATQPASDAAEKFIVALEGEKYEEAHGQLCSSARTRYTVEQVSSIAKARGKVTGHDIRNVSVSNYNGDKSATVRARLDYAGGASGEHFFRLVDEDGTWRVCGQPY